MPKDVQHRHQFTPLGDVNDHFWLMTGMAKSLNVDLAGAMADGRLAPAEYAGLVTACRGCSAPAACRAKLDSVEGHKHAPTYCENADVFADLAD